VLSSLPQGSAHAASCPHYDPTVTYSLPINPPRKPEWTSIRRKRLPIGMRQSQSSQSPPLRTHHRKPRDAVTGSRSHCRPAVFTRSWKKSARAGLNLDSHYKIDFLQSSSSPIPHEDPWVAQVTETIRFSQASAAGHTSRRFRSWRRGCGRRQKALKICRKACVLAPSDDEQFSKVQREVHFNIIPPP
jgi:hypothetical protein